MGETIKVVDNASTAINYSYDVYGNLTSMAGPSGTTTITYDSLGRKTSMNDPDKGVWNYRYNNFGELIEQTDALGNRIVHRYDSLGRVTETEYRSPGTTEGFLFETVQNFYDSAPSGSFPSGLTTDSGTNALGKPVLTLKKNASQTITFAESFHYDALGRGRQTKTYVQELNQIFTTKQTFDAIGRVFQSEDGSSEKERNGHRGIQYSYNSNGYIEAIKDMRIINGSQKVYEETLAMDALGNVTSKTLGNGLGTTLSYDPRSTLLTSIQTTSSSGTVQNLSYAWDMRGNLLSRTDRGRANEQATNLFLKNTF